MSPWIAIPLTAFVTLSLVWELRDAGRFAKSLRILRTIRPWMVVANIPIIVLALGAFVLLDQISFMQWSWMSLIGGSGNSTLIGLQYDWWFALPFAALLFLALPLLAELEEQIFREGTRNWPHGIVRSVVFGLIHTAAGVSLAAGFALIIAGLWFTYQYFKGGVSRSTSYHIAWNVTLVSVLVVSLVFV